MILFSSSGTARGRVGLREPALARRPDPGRVGRQLRRALGEDGGGLPRRRRGAALAVGQRPDPEAVAARVNGRDDLAAVFVVHSETSTGADGRRRRRSPSGTRERGRAARGRRDLVARRGAARDRRLGPRRGRDRLAEGADDAAGAGVRVASPSARGSAPHGDEPALLARLGRARWTRRPRARRRSRRPSRSSWASTRRSRPDRGRRARGAVRAHPRLGRGVRAGVGARASSCSRPTATTARW